ncbi:RNA polymerase factor sigma-54 [Clostridia bacterium]|nr:RNA polymerase factor sigma-54 [Clostridia bacterium]
MDIRQGVNVVQSQKQKLKMTPELRQAIQILQYSTLELGQFIREQLLVNPLLTLNDAQPELDMKEVDWEELAELPNDKRGSMPSFDETVDYASLIAGEVTLQEHLVKQTHFLEIEPQEHALLIYLIRSVNEDGYLEIDDAQLLEMFRISEEMLKSAIGLLQSFDPPGVGARSLEECLRIQADQAGLQDETFRRLVDEFLEDIGRNRVRQVAAKLSLSLEELEGYLEKIREFEPRPGRAFYSGKGTKYIRPDLFVSELNGDFQLIGNEGGLPKLYINEFYRSLLKKEGVALETSEYIRNNLNAAIGLIRSIEQRKDSIMTVADTILKHQGGFFKEGPIAMKPMTMKEIAKDTGLHESTVSRVSNGKYLQCKWGIFELKDFFSSGLNSQSGGDVSSIGIRVRIRELVDAEDKKSPISDQKITDILKGENIQISRRTVAKYRQEMKIPSTSERKKF